MELNALWVSCRIDYQIATPGIAARARAASIYKEARFSDHAPLIIDYDFTLRVRGFKSQAMMEDAGKSGSAQQGDVQPRHSLKRSVAGQQRVALAQLQTAGGLQRIGSAQAVAHPHGRSELHHIAGELQPPEVWPGKKRVVATQCRSIVGFHRADPAFQPGQTTDSQAR